jgi:large conductance mechanosensitive channel
MGLIKEFRDFALKGNVIDMAVGVIIGGAFGGIVKSLIEDLIMPVVGIAAKADFSNLFVPLTQPVAAAVDKAGGAMSLAEARKVGPVLAWGNFATIVINFAILAACVFLIVKAMNAAQRRFERQQIAAPPDPPPDVKLLTEIRDILKQGPAARQAP